jgi:hypothetical protein
MALVMKSVTRGTSFVDDVLRSASGTLGILTTNIFRYYDKDITNIPYLWVAIIKLSLYLFIVILVAKNVGERGPERQAIKKLPFKYKEQNINTSNTSCICKKVVFFPFS